MISNQNVSRLSLAWANFVLSKKLESKRNGRKEKINQGE